MKNLKIWSVVALAASSAMIIADSQPAEALVWDWNYSGANINASGIFTSNDTPNDLGFYQITGINGKRNGDDITGLFTTGVPIPGNEPFEIDNLISLNPQQLTGDGFGYSTSKGNFVSPFFASFLPVPGYLEVFSAPPLIPGFENFGPEDTELSINFSATPRPIPENSPAIALIAFFGFMAVTKLGQQRKSSKINLKSLSNII